jgi:hypothetical protein
MGRDIGDQGTPLSQFIEELPQAGGAVVDRHRHWFGGNPRS